MNDYTTPASIIAITGTGKIGNQSLYKNDSNEALLGEKFQFSSVLKSTVDTVEKTYSDAQNPKQNLQNPISSNTAPREDGFSESFDDEIVASHTSSLEDASTAKKDIKNNENHFQTAENESKDLPSENKTSTPASTEDQLVSSNKHNAAEVFGEMDNELAIGQNTAANTNSKQGIDTIGQDKTTAAAGTPIDKVSSNDISKSALDAPIINMAIKATENKTSASNQVAEPSSQAATKISGEVLSSVALNKKTSELSDDINKMVVKNTKERSPASQVQSANNSSTNKQEQDLSNRLLNNPNSRVKISVDKTGDKMDTKVIHANASQLNAVPSHTKAPTAQLAEISLEESQISSAKSATGKLSSTSDSRASNHHSIITSANASPQSQQANALNESQMLRQNFATIGAQQSASNQSAMGPKAPILVDLPGIAGTSGPTNQTQQVNKVAPPPPPPPPKPPVPIEQVAVQIKKAIGEGADRINIKLQPANLGKVEVKMEIGKDGILTANVIAEKPETLEMLQRDVRGLEKVLQEGGLKTDNQSFNFSLKQQSQQQAANRGNETNENQNNNDEHANAEDAGNNEDNDTSSSEGIIYGQNIATNGGVNIMI